jgi:diguanylate cyclase (GGDEF)-like protein
VNGVQRSRYLLAAVAASLGLASALPGPTWAGVAFYEAGAWLSLALVWTAVLRVGRARRSWVLVALALSLWVVGDLVWDLLLLNGRDDVVSFADVIYLAGYVVFAAAVLTMLRRRTAGRREALLDGTAFASAAAVVIWITLARPQTGAGGDTVTSFVLAAYPLMDAVLLAALLWLVLTPGGDGWAQRLLITSMVAMAIVDFAFAAFSQAGLDAWVSFSNAWYPAVYALASIAFAHAEAGTGLEVRAPRHRPRLHPGRALLLGTALVLAPAAAAVSATSEASVDRFFLLAVTCAISIMVLTRFVNEAHARERIHEEALHLASHDPLTGLMNRRAFLAELDRLLADQRCALLYIDLDGFKWLNDSSGHNAGDDALVNAAHRLLAAVRDADVVARLGGDEFAVCCPALAEITAVELLAERVRASLERIHPGMTASVGVAVSRAGDSAPTLLKSADTAMYRAKRAGGNKTWTDLTPAGAAH